MVFTLTCCDCQLLFQFLQNKALKTNFSFSLPQASHNVWNTQRTETQINQSHALSAIYFFLLFPIWCRLSWETFQAVRRYRSRTALMWLSQLWCVWDDSSPALSHILAKLCWTHEWVDKHHVSASAVQCSDLNVQLQGALRGREHGGHKHRDVGKLMCVSQPAGVRKGRTSRDD